MRPCMDGAEMFFDEVQAPIDHLSFCVYVMSLPDGVANRNESPEHDAPGLRSFFLRFCFPAFLSVSVFFALFLRVLHFTPEFSQQVSTFPYHPSTIVVARWRTLLAL